ncbi:GNAT family acetyltransferase [Dictyobacter alpinus]|uniref:GNAT family acetyltransferase n=1 Tax=Dictyobacter alpinus TaxID=2014873 RepID=A0A402B7U6_9CHLR|nr:GNAT family N-acetyltransferase [Dictyobacter alpinus]GCE27483.1 GNAT family acetyltransferase [Dictyobacter alpinus]
MSTSTVRQLQPAEIPEIVRFLTSYAFRATPPLPEKAVWQKDFSYLDEATIFAAFEDGKPVASASSSLIQQNIRGHFYHGGGVWGVTTHPAGRRKGYARTMLASLLARMNEDGNAISVLYPFRESFYTRLGYTTFSQPKLVRFSPIALQPLLKKDLGGEVEMLEIAQGFELYADYLHRQHSTIHGFGRFSAKVERNLRERNAHWLAIARSTDGEIKGMMLYKIKGNGDDLQVTHFWYDDIQGRYLLLEWFARHIDHVKEVEIRLPSFERPETWWPDMNVQTTSLEAPLGRVINITRLNGMQTGPGRFTAHVSDEYCPWNNGDYLFETIDGRLQISSSQSAECELSIQAVASLIYGTNEPATFSLRDWGNPSAELQATMQHMFPLLQPFLHEVF